nr:immunoglobulin light chain junction region [Macaca mulatta]
DYYCGSYGSGATFVF